MASPFKQLGLLSWLSDHLKSLGFKTPTDVQKNCIPAILNQKSDVLACAETGSGKTAAFALPILNELSKDPFGIFAVILSPTQELCKQIAESIRLLGRPINVKVVECLGGQDMVKQASLLAQKPHIVVATPGRLADHLRMDKNRIRLSQVEFLVMDEADRLLDKIDCDFEEDLMVLFESLPEAKKRRTLMFSATLTDTLQQIQAASSRKPFLYQQKGVENKKIKASETSEAPKSETGAEAEAEEVVEKINLPENLELKLLPIQENVKDAHLLCFLDEFRETDPKSLIIIFTKTCKNCQLLGMILTASGHKAAMLHSEMRHRERMKTLTNFKSSNVKILVATDVAARGLDIPSCNLVVNHNIPADHKTFIHRVGRTARAGKNGLALSLLSVWDINRVKNIEKYTDRMMKVIEGDDEKVSKIMVQVRMLRTDCELKLRNNKNLFAGKKKSWNIESSRKAKRRMDHEVSGSKKPKKT